MRKIVLLLATVLCMMLAFSVSCAEEDANILGKWYFSAFEDAENYPGAVFTADGADRYFSVYTDGTSLVVIDSRQSGAHPEDAVLENGILSFGYEKFSLEDGKLVQRYGSITEFYTREPMNLQLPRDASKEYGDALLPEHYNGTWVITKYGMNNAYADAESIGLSGKAVIENGKIALTWTRNGNEKHFELAFSEELNQGRLYTVVDDSVSYIISMRYDHTILLNVGMNQAQWVLRKENVIDESTVHPDAPEFEASFAAIADWNASDETRNRLASLLLNTAIASSVDPAAVNMDGPFYLAFLAGDSGKPLLICEGAGAYANYILSIGRGVSMKTQEPFVYYNWADQFFIALRHPEKSVTEQYRNEILPLVTGENIWSVQVDVQ